MNLLLTIVSLTVFAAAAPPQGLSKRQGALTGPIPAQGQVECDGEPGRTYCFDEVVWGKGMLSLWIPRPIHLFAVSSSFLNTLRESQN